MELFLDMAYIATLVVAVATLIHFLADYARYEGWVSRGGYDDEDGRYGSWMLAVLIGGVIVAALLLIVSLEART